MKAFSFEFEKIKNIKKILPISILIIIVSIAFVYFSILEYESFLNKKERFIEYERLRVMNFISYEVYGAQGLTILYEGSPLSICINSSSLKRVNKCNFDTGEIIRINNSRRGRSHFTDDKNPIHGFGNWVYILGSLTVLLLGVTAFKSPGNIKLHRKAKYIISSVSNRFLVSFLFFSALFALAYFIPLVSGIKFSGTDLKTYSLYSFYTLMLLMLFFIAGVSLASEGKEKKGMKYVYAVMFWLLTVFGIPEVTAVFISWQADKIQPEEALNVDKFSRLMDFEKASAKKFYKLMEKKGADPYKIAQDMVKEYMEKIHPAQNLKEEKFLNQEQYVMSLKECCSLLFPTTYHQFLSREMPGSGDYAHILFFDYIMKLRDEFLEYYIYKRYYEKDKTVDNFIKASENIFKAPPVIPRTYVKGLVNLFLYQLMFGMLAFIRIRRVLKCSPQIPKSGHTASEPGHFLEEEYIKPGFTTYFILRKNEEERYVLFHSFENMENTACLDKFSTEDIDLGVKPISLLIYLCEIQGTELEYALETLRTLGIENIYTMKRKELNTENMKKIYAAAVLNRKSEIIVLNDFIRKESKDFEDRFRKLLREMEKQGKIILYMSSEFYETRLQQQAQKDEVPEKTVRINLDEVSLR